MSLSVDSLRRSQQRALDCLRAIERGGRPPSDRRRAEIHLKIITTRLASAERA